MTRMRAVQVRYAKGPLELVEPEAPELIGVVGSLKVDPLPLILGSRSIKGWYSGTSIDSQQTLRFSVLTGVRSINEVFPPEPTAEAYQRMLSGDPRFRVVR